MFARAFLAFALAIVAAPAAADVPVLVELFTSEGCSSCPPADAFLARLVNERASGIRVVALSEHVDYWDDLGWRDRFSSPVFTRRQEAYAHRLRLSAVYTPQLVVAGRIDALGSDERAARSAIAAAAREPSGRVDARIVAREAAELGVVVHATWGWRRRRRAPRGRAGPRDEPRRSRRERGPHPRPRGRGPVALGGGLRGGRLLRARDRTARGRARGRAPRRLRAGARRRAGARGDDRRATVKRPAQRSSNSVQNSPGKLRATVRQPSCP